jgi:peptide/nickel transport system permease protein
MLVPYYQSTSIGSNRTGYANPQVDALLTKALSTGDADAQCKAYDEAQVAAGAGASPEQVQRIRVQMGLDQPVVVQYARYVGNLLQGDLGTSIFRFIPVREGLVLRFPATFELAVFAMFIAVVIGIPAGVLAAVKRGTLIDTGIMFAALAGVSFPVFWLGIILIYAFAVNLGWLPSSGRIDVSISTSGGTGFFILDAILQRRWAFLGDALKHLILPGFALGTIPLAIVVRMTRSAMLEVLGQDYIRTARAKGLRESVVVRKHALRNALLPVVTVIGLSFGTLLSGAILTETVFSWPGIGSWVYQAISSRDYPIIQGGVMFVAFMFVFVNLLVDLSYALIDPRIQYS